HRDLLGRDGFGFGLRCRGSFGGGRFVHEVHPSKNESDRRSKPFHALPAAQTCKKWCKTCGFSHLRSGKPAKYRRFGRSPVAAAFAPGPIESPIKSALKPVEQFIDFVLVDDQ